MLHGWNPPKLQEADGFIVWYPDFSFWLLLLFVIQWTLSQGCFTSKNASPIQLIFICCQVLQSFSYCKIYNCSKSWYRMPDSVVRVVQKFACPSKKQLLARAWNWNKDIKREEEEYVCEDDGDKHRDSLCSYDLLASYCLPCFYFQKPLQKRTLCLSPSCVQ